MDRKILDRGKHKMRWQYSNGEEGDLNAGFDINLQGSKKAMIAIVDEVRKFIEGMPLTEKEKQKELSIAEQEKPRKCKCGFMELDCFNKICILCGDKLSNGSHPSPSSRINPDGRGMG